MFLKERKICGMREILFEKNIYFNNLWSKLFLRYKDYLQLIQCDHKDLCIYMPFSENFSIVYNASASSELYAMICRLVVVDHGLRI